ncbi:MAG: hypothetical protein JWQ02_4290 [Capsulimonas sp.]|nr:hypothetical protein [Capsulimonas sp.]
MAQGWAGELYPYVKSTGAFKCPDDSTAQPCAFTPVSYGMNDSVSYDSGAGQSLTKLNAPASSVLLFECNGAISVWRDYFDAADFERQLSQIKR